MAAAATAMEKFRPTMARTSLKFPEILPMPQLHVGWRYQLPPKGVGFRNSVFIFYGHITGVYIRYACETLVSYSPPSSCLHSERRISPSSRQQDWPINSRSWLPTDVPLANGLWLPIIGNGTQVAQS